MGRIPLKTRGRDDEIADSDILLFDSGVMTRNAAAFDERLKKGWFHCTGAVGRTAPFVPLDVDESGIDQRQRRPHQHSQYRATHKNHQQVTHPAADPVIDLYGVVGQHVAQNMTAVERRNGQQVEEEQRQVDQNGQGGEQHQCLQAGRGAQGKTTSEGGQDQQAAIGNRHGDNSQHNEGPQDQHQVRNRAGQRDQVLIADNLAEVAGNDRSGLGPSHQHAAEHAQSKKRSEDHDGGKEQSPDKVHVVHGVEGYAALQAGGLVSQPRGHPRMRALVKAQRKNEQDKFEDGNDKAAGLQCTLQGASKLRLAWRVRGKRPEQAAGKGRVLGKVPEKHPSGELSLEMGLFGRLFVQDAEFLGRNTIFGQKPEFTRFARPLSL